MWVSKEDPVNEPVNNDVIESTQRVLVVEDLPALREHFVETIEEIGSHLVVDQAGDGIEALEKLDALDGDYDLIVTDITMPRMDGEQFIAALVERGCSVPVIVSRVACAITSLSQPRSINCKLP